MSLRNMSVIDGYGPAVSVGVTAQLEDEVVELVDEPDVLVDDGLVDESLPHPKAIPRPAPPSALSAFLRSIDFFSIGDLP
jgi:hypothetical protein